MNRIIKKQGAICLIYLCVCMCMCMCVYLCVLLMHTVHTQRRSFFFNGKEWLYYIQQSSESEHEEHHIG